MSNEWNIKIIQRIAGLPITESVEDDDDDMTPAEKALADKAEKDLKKQGVKVKNIDPDKDISKLAKKVKGNEEKAESNQEKAEAEEKKAADVEKKEEKAEAPVANPKTAKKLERKAAAAKAEAKAEPKAEEKKEEKPAPEAAAKKAAQAREWLKSNPGAKRGEFIKHVGAAFGMTPHYANQQYYRLKGKLNEYYVINHPYLPGFSLAENREMGTYQWVDTSSPFDQMIFTKKADAEEIAQYMSDWKSQQTVIEHVVFESEDDKDEEDEPVDKDALKKVSAAREWVKANPDKSREEFAAHTKEKHGWAGLTANSFFDSFKNGKAEAALKKD